MAQRLGGTDPAEIRDAFGALFRVRSPADVRRLVEESPTVRSPGFLTALRRDYMRAVPKMTDQQLRESFLHIYDALLFALHDRLYAEVCAEPGAPAGLGTDDDRRLPPLHQSVRAILSGHRLPPDADEIGALLRGVPLPARIEEDGVSWSLFVAQCAGCRTVRAVSNAHLLDLVRVPALAQDIGAGRFAPERCPHCGDVRGLPVALLDQDAPLCGDPLESMSGIVRISQNVVIFRPPPGTPDRQESRVLLEMRFHRLLGREEWAVVVPLAGQGIRTMIVVYSEEELASRLPSAEPDSLPLGMRAVIEDIAGKLRDGGIGFSEAEAFLDVAQRSMAGWPLIPTPAQVGHDWHALAQALVAERVARARDEPANVRAHLAAVTAIMYLAVRERGAANQCLYRAERLVDSMDPGDPITGRLRVVLAHTRADLLDAEGDRGSAQRLRDANDASFLMDPGNALTELLTFDDALRRGANALAGHDFLTALDVLPPVISQLRERSGDHDRVLLRHRLSGALGNLGAALGEIADRLQIARAVLGGDLPSLPPRADPREAVKQVEALRPQLWELFPAGFAPEQVRRAAIGTLHEAITIAEEVGAWEFAAIQANRLMRVLDAAGRTEEATSWARRAEGFAGRVGARDERVVGAVRLAKTARASGDGETALAHLSTAALEDVRSAVSLGHRVGEAGGSDKTAYLASGVLGAVEAGGSHLTAALILESLKAATTAVAMSVGLPTASEADVNPRLASRLGAARNDRERLRLRLTWNPGDAGLLRELAAIDADLAALRRELSLESRDFMRWVDANNVYLTDERAFQRRLADLGPGTRYLGIMRVDIRVCTYLLGGDRARMVVREVPALPADAPYAEVAALAADLLAPFHDELEQLGTEDRVIISPDLTLLGLPFAAVQEHGIISHVHGAGMLEALGERARRAYEKALLIGAPARADLPDLPAARREVKAIRGVFPAGRTLVGPAATVPGLLDGIADQDVLHFACHATTSGAESAGRLMLAPDLVAGDSGELSEDRVLAEVSPAPGCLVNLAGCRTAHQAARPGPLIAGLVPAFLAAGAGHVLATLWPLDDEAAMTFQTALYRELARDGHPPAALARCRRLAGKGALGEAVRAPEAWAGYVLYGI